MDSGSQVIPLLFMALGQRDVSKVQLGELTPYTYVYRAYLICTAEPPNNGHIVTGHFVFYRGVVFSLEV